MEQNQLENEKIAEESEDFGFVFLPSYYKMVSHLPAYQRGAVYDAVMKCVFTGEAPSGLSRGGTAVFVGIMENVTRQRSRYLSSVKNGRKGGRPKKT
ncbi:MAG: DUF6291 domain-containing protein [Oscillospiraceae bacterium]|nr:DUF6291 domain-containing protein [Oscillospiraceae bacterium]